MNHEGVCRTSPATPNLLINARHNRLIYVHVGIGANLLIKLSVYQSKETSYC